MKIFQNFYLVSAVLLFCIVLISPCAADQVYHEDYIGEDLDSELKQNFETAGDAGTYSASAYFPRVPDSRQYYLWSNDQYHPQEKIEKWRFESENIIACYWNEDCGYEDGSFMIRDSADFLEWTGYGTTGVWKDCSYPHFMTQILYYAFRTNDYLPHYFDIGDSWSEHTTVTYPDVEYEAISSVLREEAITVPAGTYQSVCIETEFTCNDSFIDGTRRIWLAENVGLVKLIYTHDDGSVTKAERVVPEATTVVSADFSAGGCHAYAGDDPIIFTDWSSGNPTSWHWDFGDGNTSDLQNPDYVYTTPGTYTVTLYVSGTNGSDSVTKDDYVHIHEPVVPTAILFSNVISGPAPLVVQFFDYSLGNPTAWGWDFGDEITSDLQNPSHTYTTAGTYTVSLTVTNAAGSDTETITDYITVTAPESESSPAVFILNQNLVTETANDTLTFGNHVGQYGYHMAIVNGGDESQNTILQNPTFSIETADITEYSWPGYAEHTGDALVWNFPASFNLNVGSQLSTYATTSKTEQIHFSPDLNRVLNKTNFTQSGVQHLEFTIHFSDLDFVNSWGRIEYPDSEYVTASKVPYSITTDAPVFWEFGTDRDEFVFNQSRLSVNEPYYFSVDVQVTTDRPVTYKPKITVWTVSEKADRSLPSGKTAVVPDDMLPQYVQNAAAGSDAETDWILSRMNNQVVSLCGVIDNESGVTADFIANVTTGPAPLTVQFNDTSTGSPTSWEWAFGDGEIVTGQNPVHIYALPGTYTVNLTVSDAYGESMVCRDDYITVTASPLEAQFSANVSSGMAPLAVQFTDESVGEVTDRSWDFGDGKYSLEQNPVHVYANPGIYSVSLTVRDAYSEKTVTKPSFITVTQPPAPVAAFSSNSTSGTVPLTVRFTDTSTGSPTSWEWAFGDGETATGQNPVHTYALPGTYTVNLTVFNGYGESSISRDEYITVTASPLEAQFSANVCSGMAPLAVQFTDESVGAVTYWSWDFGDGKYSTEQNPVHVYTDPGTYSVSLTVQDAYSEKTVTKPSFITVTQPQPALVASFSANATSGNAPLAVQFTDTSTGNPTTWNWSFGDGSISSEQNPLHAYAVSGIYNVTLVINGGEDICTKPDYITVVPPLLIGDANNDGAVNQADTLCVLKEVVGISPIPVVNSDRFLQTDVHQNGYIDVGDAMFIAQYNVGLRDASFILLP